MTSIRTRLLPTQRLNELKGNKQAVATITAAAKQEGSEIIFKDKNDQIQTATLDEYLNNPGLSKFEGAKSATLTLEVGQRTFLIDVKELNQDNLLKALSAAVSAIETKGSDYKAHARQFKETAAPIFKSIKASIASAQAPGIDEATRQSLRKEPVPRTIGTRTQNFSQVLSDLNSPGDSIDIRLEASASVKIWGPLGIQASGNAGINVSIDDDGLFYVKFTANADVGVNASGSIGGNEVSASGALGAGVGVVYRFKNQEQVNQFLLQKFNESLPDAVRKEFLPELDKNTHKVNVKPTTLVSAYGKIQGKVDFGKISVEASFETRTTHRSFYQPDGSKATSVDYNATTQVDVGIGEDITLSGTYSRFEVQKDNISENTGKYVAIEGALTFTFSEEQASALRKGKADHIRAHIQKAADNLGLTGGSRQKFIDGVLARAKDKIDALEGKKKTTGSVTLGVAVQAQWERAEDGGSGELQYFRLGTFRETSQELAINVGVLKGSIKGSASITDLTDVKVGTQDETYLAGLYKYNRAQYDVLKARLGGEDTQVSTKVIQDNKIVTDPVTGEAKTISRSLKEWEAIWDGELAQTQQEKVEIERNEYGKAEFLYDFVTKNFGSLDTSDDGFIYTNEIEHAIEHNTFQKPEQKEALEYLLKHIAELEELSNDEYLDEDDGITKADLKVFIENMRG